MSRSERIRWNHQTGERYVVGQRRQSAPARSNLPRPMLIRDFQDDVLSHADGRYYSSRKHWRDHLKAHGMVELGNDMPSGPDTPPAITDADIAEAYEQCEAGKGAKGTDRLPADWEGNPEELATGDDI